MPPPRLVIVVPCFDEAPRLDVDGLVELAALTDALVLVVDDGSTDATPELLAAAAADHDALTVMTLATNRGKGEAVRQGLRRGIELGAPVVAYYDADLATPVEEMARLVATLDARPDVAVVLGARVGLLGHDISRSLWRHYLGRLFATASSAVLGLGVYDTQCGAKVLRVGPELRAALARPFVGRWSFDVELLGRLNRRGVPPGAFLEVPLRAWSDVRGSKLGLRGAVAAALDLGRVAIALRREP